MDPSAVVWRTKIDRRAMVAKIEESIQQTGVQIKLSGAEMENLVFVKVKSQEQYMIMVARIILHLRRIALLQKGELSPEQVLASLGQPSQKSSGQAGVVADAIDALQNLCL